MDRTDLLDTSPEMHKKFVELMRKKSPEWKLAKTCELCDAARMMFPMTREKLEVLNRKRDTNA